MIKFLKISVENFLSSQSRIEIPLNESKITLVHGENGAMKSGLFIDSIFYALYGKSFRKSTLSEMINRDAKKKLLVELSFVSGLDTYKIVRGMKPNRFEIWKGEEMLIQDSHFKDQQEFLQKSILKMDEKTFRSLVVIGSSSYTPFLKLVPAERRIVLEDLLRIDVLSSLRDKTKTLVSTTKESLYAQDRTLAEHRAIIDTQERMKAQIRSDSSKKIEDIQKKISEEESKIKEVPLSNESGVLNKCKEIFTRKMAEYDKEKSNYRILESSSVCPLCKQNVSGNDILEPMKEKIKKDVDTLRAMKAALDKQENKVRELTELYNEQNRIAVRIRAYRDEIQSLSRVPQITEVPNRIQELSEELEDTKTYMAASQYLDNLLKDDGIRSRILALYIPKINSLITKYLQILGFPEINFKLSDQFQETITQGNHECTYASFSEGEKLRIDHALMFALREIARIRSSVSTSLLIADESDHGVLDEEGFSRIVQVFREIEEQVIVISHAPEKFSEVADRTITVTKEHESRITIY